MIVADSGLSSTEQADLVQFERYLRALNIADAAFAVVPASAGKQAAPVVLRYWPAGADDYARAELEFPMAGGTGIVEGELPDLGTFLCMLLAHGWAEKARELEADASPVSVFEHLDLPDSLYWRQRVAPLDPGNHVAPDGQGFAFFYVENNGVMRVFARSKQAAPVILRLAASVAEERIDLASKMAPYYPD